MRTVRYLIRIPLLFAILTMLWSAYGCAPHRRGRPVPDGTPPAQDVTASEHAETARWLQGQRSLQVGLAVDLTTAKVVLNGDVRLVDRGAADAEHDLPPGELTFTARDAGVEVAANGVSPRAMSATVRLRVDSDAQPWRYGKHIYAGDLQVTNHDGRLTLVNVVDLETYLRGVVPWEIGRPGEKGLAALEAQAVAARTYTISHLGERSDYGFDIWADVRDQVYRGLDGVDPWCDLAISNTAGQVLRFDGREIEAYYSSTCGGRSSNIHEVWPRPHKAYLVSRQDSQHGAPDFCGGSRYYRWETAWTRAELDSILAQSLPAYYQWWSESPARRRWAGEAFRPTASTSSPESPGALVDVKILSRTRSGRVSMLELRTTAGLWRIRGDRVRWVLTPASGSPRILRSAWFDLTIHRDQQRRPSRVVAQGRGFGHGIGMCQVGALKMAELGSSYRQILAHYYPGSRLEAAWSE